MHRSQWRRVCTGLLSILCGCAQAAQNASPPQPPWKLTLGEYAYASYVGTDINLRWRRADSSAWVGLYSDQSFGTQARLGVDTSVEVAKYLQLQPSLQLATLGFLGGSLNLLAGGTWYGIAGIGRTNTKPYFNLNFDPNDALTFGAGHRGENGSVYSVFLVADDRLHTHQRDWHGNARFPYRDMRVTLDLLRKSGSSDAGPITAWGFGATWDWPSWFLRLTYDPYQNFSAQDAWRAAAGIRF